VDRKAQETGYYQEKGNERDKMKKLLTGITLGLAAVGASVLIVKQVRKSKEVKPCKSAVRIQLELYTFLNRRIYECERAGETQKAEAFLEVVEHINETTIQRVAEFLNSDFVPYGDVDDDWYIDGC
jgi:hypothetical protein